MVLSWVAGNDMFLCVWLYETILVDGRATRQPFDFSTCDSAESSLVSKLGRKFVIPHEFHATDMNGLIMQIPCTIPPGKYSIDIKVVQDGYHLRSFEGGVVGIVVENAHAHTTFERISGAHHADYEIELGLIPLAEERPLNMYEEWKLQPGHEDMTFDDFMNDYAQQQVEVAVGDALDSKVDKVQGKGLSTNDFTDILKGKLDDMPNLKEVDSRELDGMISDSDEGFYVADGPGGPLLVEVYKDGATVYQWVIEPHSGRILVRTYNTHAISPAWSEFTDAYADKQDTISDLSTIRSGAAAGATAVQNKGSESNIVVGVGNSSNIGITSSSIGMETGNSAILIGNDITMNTSGAVKYNGSRVATAADLQGKQDVIRDLQTIRDGAAAGATAVQPAALREGLAGKQDTLTFDSTPTANSTNPATSGGIKTALDAKQGTLTFDSTPTANSTNPVTSGGIKTALDAKQATIDDLSTIRSGASAGATAVQPDTLAQDIAALPDNEDIEYNSSDKLQFANKAYNAAAFSGLGRVYLRKNIVDVSGTDKNVLTQAMVNTANTIYHIQYDYDLNGQTITLPAGCVLEFDGGSLSDTAGTGKIVFADTKIKGDATILCDYEGTIDGMVQGQWFGLVPNDNTFDNSPIIEKVCTTFNQVTIAGGKYYCSTPIVLSMGQRKKLFVYADLEYTEQNTSDVFITISGIYLFVGFYGTIYGPMQSIPSGNTTELSIGVRFENLNDCDVYIKEMLRFHTNVQILGKDNGSGTSYNSFDFNTLVGAKVLLHLKAEGTGWVTTNTFKCNRMTTFGGYTMPDTAILVEGDSVGFSDCVFTKLSIEGLNVSEPIKLYNTGRMKFTNIRSEGNYQYLAYVENSKEIHFQANYGDVLVRCKAKEADSVYDDNEILVPFAPLEGAIKRPDGNNRTIVFACSDATKSQDINYGAVSYIPVGFIIPLTYKPMLFASKDKFTLTVVYYDSSLNVVTRSDAIMPSGTVSFKNSSKNSNWMETTSLVNKLCVCLPELSGVSYVGYFFSTESGKDKTRWNPIFQCPQKAMEVRVSSFLTYEQFKEYPHYGATAKRPVITENWRNFVVGFEYFDTDLGKPIYAKSFDSSGNGTWVDATGATV